MRFPGGHTPQQPRPTVFGGLLAAHRTFRRSLTDRGGSSGAVLKPIAVVAARAMPRADRGAARCGQGALRRHRSAHFPAGRTRRHLRRLAGCGSNQVRSPSNAGRAPPAYAGLPPSRRGGRAKCPKRGSLVPEPWPDYTAPGRSLKASCHRGPITLATSTNETLPMSCAIAVMAKAPRPGHSKTRLSPPLTPEEARDMSAAFLRDITENIRAAAQRCRHRRLPGLRARRAGTAVRRHPGGWDAACPRGWLRRGVAARGGGVRPDPCCMRPGRCSCAGTARCAC